MNVEYVEHLKSEVFSAKGDNGWVKPTWSGGVAGRVREVLKLSVTYTQVGVCHILEEN